jgi:N-carbamoylputrescine amidase
MKIFLLLLVSFNLYAFEPTKVALVQYNADNSFLDYDKHMTDLTAYAEEAVEQGAKIIVLPEGSTYGYMDASSDKKFCRPSATQSWCVNVDGYAEIIPEGRTTLYWENFARQHQVYVVYNLPEKATGGVYYNTSGVVGPNGYIGKYSKRQLYYVDSYYAGRGSSELLLQTPYGNFGILICADINNGNFARSYKTQGAHGILFPTDWDERVPEALRDFSRAAVNHNIDYFASDVSAWDGTGFYSPSLGLNQRLRPGLAASATNQDGLVLIDIAYQ